MPAGQGTHLTQLSLIIALVFICGAFEVVYSLIAAKEAVDCNTVPLVYCNLVAGMIGAFIIGMCGTMFFSNVDSVSEREARKYIAVIILILGLVSSMCGFIMLSLSGRDKTDHPESDNHCDVGEEGLSIGAAGGVAAFLAGLYLWSLQRAMIDPYGGMAQQAQPSEAASVAQMEAQMAQMQGGMG